MTHQTKTRRATGRDDLDATGAPRCRRLFSIEQAAQHAGVPVATILHWTRTGRLRTYRVHGGEIRIDEVELDDFLSSL